VREERLQLTARRNSNEIMRGKGEFFHLADRASDHPFVEKVWRCHTDRRDTFLSVAANSCEMVLTRLRGRNSGTFTTFTRASAHLDDLTVGQCCNDQPAE
jgi:hypothetical protein